MRRLMVAAALALCCLIVPAGGAAGGFPTPAEVHAVTGSGCVGRVRPSPPSARPAPAWATSVVSTVKVYVHVLRTSRGGAVSRARLAAQFAVWNGAYAGDQSRYAASVPFRFRLVDVDVTVNRQWYRMDEGSVAERHAKAALHRGGAQALNLYIGSNRAGDLGWGTQPRAYRAHPLMDGVVIARRTMPNGRGGHYSAGDTVVHESGHWLGLLHTFAGGCSRRGDGVVDTAPEARPSYSCPVRRDTCIAAGRDPVHNFMDYSYDSCLDQFTAGQSERMVRSWDLLRRRGDS